MQHNTKNEIANALKKLSAKKSLDKITIVDIVKCASVNRQTFYYHFTDIYDLIDYIYVTEGTDAINGNYTYDTWQKGYIGVFDYILKNKMFVKNTYNSISHEKLESFLNNEAYILIRQVLDEKIPNDMKSHEEKDFIANFYKFAFTGIILEWINNGMKENPEFLVSKVDKIIEGKIIS